MQRDTPALASSTDVADFLGVSVRTLDQWAWAGTGPRYSRIGKHRRYRWTDVERFVDEHATSSDDAHVSGGGDSPSSPDRRASR